jgi:sugar/nucleoside kinase (ribokinase family)
MRPLSASGAGGRVVCLGEAIVDLACETPVPSIAEAPRFVPRVGGSLANVAVVAARFGARSQLLGGAGEDDWGAWLRERIGAEGVDVSRFVHAPGGSSSLAFVALSPSGEPRFLFYEASERPVAHASGDLESAVAGEPGVAVLGSDTLLGAEEREVSMRCAELARERGWTVLVDPNLRPGRWDGVEAMHAAVAALIGCADVLKCNSAEARELTGARTDADAVRALLDRGPGVVVATRGPSGALLATPAGVVEVPAAGRTAAVDATGAGDCVTGVLAAALAAGAAPGGLEPVLRLAMRAASGVVATRGALPGLPAVAEARSALAAAL